MKKEDSTGNKTASAASKHYNTSSVTSKDGTNIGYLQLGHGPGIILVQGAMGSAHHFMQLSEALADIYTVYVPDRRGRGLSSHDNKDYGIKKEVEDLDALLTKTGANYVFGLSSGAVILLQAALMLPSIHKIAIFEPPFFINDPAIPTNVLTRYDKEMSQGKVAAAMTTCMKGAQMGPPVFNLMPRWLLELFISIAIKSEDKNGSNSYVSMRELAPTLRYDFRLLVEMSGKQESFKDVGTDVLLLGGSKSPEYLKFALSALEKLLPHVKRIELPGLNHAASWNTDRGGQPVPVAQELRRFFTQS